MKVGIWGALLLLGIPQASWGQTSSRKESPAQPARYNYVVIGATPIQEATLHTQIEIMRPSVRPLRVVFVPHWKYVDTARTFHLHVPTGYTSAMFTHLPSRTTFIDSDRYQNEDWLGYWMAHELGHLARNSAKEGDAERAAREYRDRLKQSLPAKSQESAKKINN